MLLEEIFSEKANERIQCSDWLITATRMPFGPCPTSAVLAQSRTIFPPELNLCFCKFVFMPHKRVLALKSVDESDDILYDPFVSEI